MVLEIVRRRVNVRLEFLGGSGEAVGAFQEFKDFKVFLLQAPVVIILNRTSDTTSLITQGPVQGLCSFLEVPEGTLGVKSQTRSCSLRARPLSLLV